MDKIKLIINDEEYTLDQFRRDAIRMFDYYRTKGSDYMGKIDCKNVPCNDCPLSNKGCTTTKLRTFETIETVYNWAKDHPVVTNRDKMIETFGGAYFNLIINYISDRSLDDYDAWLNEEYKEPEKKRYIKKGGNKS